MFNINSWTPVDQLPVGLSTSEMFNLLSLANLSPANASLAHQLTPLPQPELRAQIQLLGRDQPSALHAPSSESSPTLDFPLRKRKSEPYVEQPSMRRKLHKREMEKTRRESIKAEFNKLADMLDLPRGHNTEKLEILKRAVSELEFLRGAQKKNAEIERD